MRLAMGAGFAGGEMLVVRVALLVHERLLMPCWIWSGAIRAVLGLQPRDADALRC